MNLSRNNTEELVWVSIDHLMELLSETAIYAVGRGYVSTEDLNKYMQAELNTIKANVSKGYKRQFEDIYSEFIDELIKNGEYYEYEDFLKNVRLKIVGGCDVRLP